MGVPLTAHTPRGAAAEVVGRALALRAARRAAAPPATGADVHLVNAYTLALADRDPALGAVLRDAALNLPDGQPVVWANRWLHPDTPQPPDRVYGPICSWRSSGAASRSACATSCWAPPTTYSPRCATN